MKLVYFALGIVVLLFVSIQAIENSRQDPGSRRSAVQNIGRQLRNALLHYESTYGSYPEGNYSQICRTLCGDNPKKVEFFTGDPKRFNPQGEIVDPWGTPYRIDFSPHPSAPRIESAGKNRTFESGLKESDDFRSFE